ncbi:MAG: hypothetical protein QHH10_12005 [Peptococcaceae bacterium]|jgi:replicative DNA helicase|nr:hypothetical protein [Peptococcaceae bacterium]MDH7526027.1 hypothetical protein [Peptococcaceae bacterium]
MWDHVYAEALKALEVILIALISLGCAYATLYINRLAAVAKAEAAAIKDSAQQELASQAIDMYKDLVTTVVGRIEETVAKQIRIAVKEGVKNRQDLVALSRAAYDEIMATVEPALVETIKTQIKDIETYTFGLIENAVVQVKARSGSGTE